MEEPGVSREIAAVGESGEIAAKSSIGVSLSALPMRC